MEVAAEVSNKDAAVQSLCFALRHNPEKHFIEELLNKGCRLHCEEHESPLLCLMDRDPGVILKADVIRFLLEKGVDPHVTGSDHVTPFSRALSVGAYTPEAIEVMINFLDLHPRYYVGHWAENALFNAISNPKCQMDAVKLLIDRGTSVRQKDYNNSTPLHLVVSKPHCSVGLVRILAKSNIYKNDRDYSNLTPLMMAMKYNSDPNITNVLFVAGCRVQKVPRHQFYNVLESYIVNFDIERFQNPAFIRYLKQLVKFALLEKPTFETESIPRDLGNSDLLELAENCLTEIEEMMSLHIADGCTLYEFVNPNRDLFEDPIINPIGAALSLVELMKTLSGHHFPIYWDLIVASIRRKVFKDALGETIMYLNIDHAPQMDENTILDYECVLKLCACLPNVDALNLILAFRPGLLH